MSLEHFHYGVGAVILPGQQETFNKLKDELIENTRTGTFAEQLMVDQLLHAQWELHRVRTLAGHAEAEPALHAAFTRATRNWQRAERQLAALQSARAAARLCAHSAGSVPPPAANLARIPKRKASTDSFMNWCVDTCAKGYDGPSFFDAADQQQEAA